MFHDIYHEPEIETIQKEVADWIVARVDSKKK